jgi:hypothetical protein
VWGGGETEKAFLPTAQDSAVAHVCRDEEGSASFSGLSGKDDERSGAAHRHRSRQGARGDDRVYARREGVTVSLKRRLRENREQQGNQHPPIKDGASGGIVRPRTLDLRGRRRSIVLSAACCDSFHPGGPRIMLAQEITQDVASRVQPTNP